MRICLPLLLAATTLRAAELPPITSADLPRTPATEPSAAAQAFQVRPGFHLELVAAEPDVASPVAICFDENGRLFVLEMRDYPAPPSAGPHLGRVRLLEDTDGDGRYDQSVVFADNLELPSALI